MKYQTTTYSLPKLFLSTVPTFAISFSGVLLVSFVTMTWLIRYWKSRESPLDIFPWSGFVIYLVYPPVVLNEQISLFIPLLSWVATHPSRNVLIARITWILFIPITWLAFWLG
jgi:hypothetical protein